MDNQYHDEADGLDSPTSHLRLHPAPESLTEFFPLRLVLQPSGAIVDVNRPQVVIGRHSEADIRLPLPDVSRRHCQLQYTEQGWQVVDLNSLNGIQVNGEQILQATLEEGDLLRIGGFTFSVELAEHPLPYTANGHVESIVKTLTQPQRRAS